MQNVILHLDMNSYFASVEQQDHPEYRGRPLGVCEHLGGIIIGASIEAKKWGIKTGTPVWEARKLYPKIILTHTRAQAYRFYTRRFLKVVSDYTDKVEKYSIDECFLDLTRVCNVRCKNEDVRYGSNGLYPKSYILHFADPFEEAVKIALEIKRRFKTEVGDWLTCSIGIADNKTLAKIASDLKKPDGLVVIIDKNDINDKIDKNCCVILFKDELYDRLKLADVPGIGPRQERNLNELGIKTLADLRDFPKSHLIARFGRVMGHHLYYLGQLQGTWKASVQNDDEIKSMGHMYTLPQEYREAKFFAPVLYKLCEMVGRRLRRKNLTGDILSCYYHDKNYQGFGKSVKLGYFLQDGREIFLAAENMLNVGNGLKPFPTGIKLIGITVAGLRPYIHQLSLFGDTDRRGFLMQALDKINDKYGEFTILRALQIPAGKVFRDSVGFGRVKEL